MEMFTLYILQSEKDGSYYIGYTENLHQRLEKHNAGESQYTSGKCPWKIAYFENGLTKSEAIKREKQIKRMKSRKYIEELVRMQRSSR